MALDCCNFLYTLSIPEIFKVLKSSGSEFFEFVLKSSGTVLGKFRKSDRSGDEIRYSYFV